MIQKKYLLITLLLVTANISPMDTHENDKGKIDKTEKQSETRNPETLETIVLKNIAANTQEPLEELSKTIRNLRSTNQKWKTLIDTNTQTIIKQMSKSKTTHPAVAAAYLRTKLAIEHYKNTCEKADEQERSEMFKHALILASKDSLDSLQIVKKLAAIQTNFYADAPDGEVKNVFIELPAENYSSSENDSSCEEDLSFENDVSSASQNKTSYRRTIVACQPHPCAPLEMVFLLPDGKENGLMVPGSIKQIFFHKNTIIAYSRVISTRTAISRKNLLTNTGNMGDCIFIEEPENELSRIEDRELKMRMILAADYLKLIDEAYQEREKADQELKKTQERLFSAKQLITNLQIQLEIQKVRLDSLNKNRCSIL